MNNLTAQNALVEELYPTIDRLEDKYHTQNQFWNHDHMCTFKMLCRGDLKEAERQCYEYRARKPIIFPKNWPKPSCVEDYCDFCDMMNYIALDNKGRVMYAQRINPQELIKEFDKKKNL